MIGSLKIYYCRKKPILCSLHMANAVDTIHAHLETHAIPTYFAYITHPKHYTYNHKVRHFVCCYSSLLRFEQIWFGALKSQRSMCLQSYLPFCKFSDVDIGSFPNALSNIQHGKRGLHSKRNTPKSTKEIS